MKAGKHRLRRKTSVVRANLRGQLRRLPSDRIGGRPARCAWWRRRPALKTRRPIAARLNAFHRLPRCATLTDPTPRNWQPIAYGRSLQTVAIDRAML